jgi:hypothetical protein
VSPWSVSFHGPTRIEHADARRTDQPTLARNGPSRRELDCQRQLRTSGYGQLDWSYYPLVCRTSSSTIVGSVHSRMQLGPRPGGPLVSPFDLQSRTSALG